jgi:peptidoglycan/LPS O-acetylase OafA/YrhL
VHDSVVTLTEEVAEPGSVAVSPPTIPHEPALDGLRGAAVAGVLLFHGGHLVGGYLGVDAFFVLSGFLITTLLLVEHGSAGTISLPRFWVRRARRLLPALGIVVAAVAIYAALFARTGDLPSIRGDSISTLFYFANWHAIATAGDYFAIFRSPSPLQHTWSLAIEEQFYLVWPVVLVLLLKRGMAARAAAKRVLALCIAAAGASFVLSQLLYNSFDPSRVYYGTDTRAAALLLGGALAAALSAWGPVTTARLRTVLERAAWVAVALLVWAWTRMAGDSHFLYHGGLLLCGVAVAIVIAAAVHPTRGPVANVLSFKPLCALGVISYGVYLWHWPVFVWLNTDRIRLAGWPLFLLQCAVTIAVAIVSYRVVERPIRRGWGRARTIAWAGPLAAVLLVIAVIAATPAQLPVVATWLPTSHYAPTPASPGWKKLTRNLIAKRAALARTNDRRTRVFVWGDSIALSLTSSRPGHWYRGRDIYGISVGLLGCSLLDTNRVVVGHQIEEDPNCDAWPELLREALDAYRPQVVALMMGPWEMFDRQGPAGLERAGSRELTLDIEDKLSRVHDIVRHAGARLVILDTPCFDPTITDPSGAIWRDPARRAWINRVWHDFAGRYTRDTSIVDLSTLLCPGGNPIEQQFGGQYRADGMHFTADGTTLVWQWLERLGNPPAPA